MKKPTRTWPADCGMTLYEVMIVLLGAGILAAIAVPALNTLTDSYNLVFAAQGISTQLHYARLKAITSNEAVRVHFPADIHGYRVELNDGTVLKGPYYYPVGIVPNTTDSGTPITFPARYITFLPNGGVPASGNGSSGRVMLISNRSARRVDIVVTAGGAIRQTKPYAHPPAEF